MQRPPPKKRPVQYTDIQATDSDDSDDDLVNKNKKGKEKMEEDSKGKRRRDDDVEEDDDAEEESEMEEDSEDESEEDEEEDNRAKKKRQRRSQFIEDQADSDEDESDEERTRRRMRSKFIDDAAEDVDEDEEDEDEDEDDYEEDDFIDPSERAQAKAMETQLYRDLDKRREAPEEDADEIARRLEERYKRSGYGATAAAYRGDVSHVPMQFLLPTTQDPSLWLVKCKPGKERDLAMNLMRKFVEYQQSGHPLQIKSVVARESLKGYIYVEARSMADVQTALDKMNNVYMSKIMLVPLEEMVDVLTIKKKELSVKPGSWVRIKRGIYKGDLAQVIEMFENNDALRVKLIPRLTTISMQRSLNAERDGKKKRKFQRVPQRFFKRDDKDLDFKNKAPSKQPGGYVSWGSETFDKNGFLERDIRLIGVEYENITPTLEELSKFSAAGETQEDQLDLEALSEMGNKAAAESTQRFNPGDLVTIIEGDLINAIGTVKLVDKNNVVLEMRDAALGEIYIEPSKLVKSFQLGDHVRVFRGKYKDQTGMVTQVQNNIVTVFSDRNMEQFSVFMKDIQSMGDVSVVNRSQQQYNLHELVLMGPDSVGVIIKVEPDQYRILDQHGTIRMIKQQEITQTRDSKRAVAVDSRNNTVKVGDMVEVISGEHTKRQGTILHLFRSWAFLMNKDLVETGGVFVVRTKMILSTASKNAAMGQGGQQGGPGMGGFRQPSSVGFQRRDPILHKKIIITGGPFKGYHGFVKAITEKGARVELQTSAKIITVDRSKLMIPGEEQRVGDRPDRYLGGATPMVGSKTPHVMSGAQTPSFHEMGARTPAWDAGARTPAWDAGARTPMPYGNTPRDDPTPRFGSTPRDLHRPSPYEQPSSTPAYAGPAQGGRSGWDDPRGAPTPQTTSNRSDWVKPDMEVVIRDGPYATQHARVLQVLADGSCKLSLRSGEGTTMPSQTVDPAPPLKKDHCIFMSGDYQGQTGQLIGMDGDDAIVKLEQTSDFKITPLSSICKIVGRS